MVDESGNWYSCDKQRFCLCSTLRGIALAVIVHLLVCRDSHCPRHREGVLFALEQPKMTGAHSQHSEEQIIQTCSETKTSGVDLEKEQVKPTCRDMFHCVVSDKWNTHEKCQGLGVALPSSKIEKLVLCKFCHQRRTARME